MNCGKTRRVSGGASIFTSFDVHILWVVVAVVAPSR
jgi:hypothetical protein